MKGQRIRSFFAGLLSLLALVALVSCGGQTPPTGGDDDATGSTNEGDGNCW